MGSTTTNVSKPKQEERIFNDNEERLSYYFDQFILKLKTLPFTTAFETYVKLILDAEQVTLWYNNVTYDNIYSPTLQISTTKEKSLISQCYNEQAILTFDNPSNEEKFQLGIDSSEPGITLFPILTKDEQIFGIVSCQNPKLKDLIPRFQEKFTNYSTILFHTFPSEDKSITGKLTITKLLNRLYKIFRCKSIRLFMYKDILKEYSIDEKAYKPSTEDFTEHWQLGIESAERILCTYNAFGILLDEPLTKFTAADFFNLKKLVPFVSRNTTEDPEELELRLGALLEVAEILSGVLDIDTLIPVIMERACSLLHTERCSLFIIDRLTNELVTTFQGGLDIKLRIPLSSGIVGYTATTGEIVNITDAYNDPRFDKNIDLKTGFSTKTILTVPIYDNRGEIVGVTEMINRIDGSAFDEEDIRMMTAFNVFCGISLDNAKLYKSSIDLTQQLRSFVEVSTSLNKKYEVSRIVEEILQNAKDVATANRVILFLHNPDTNSLDNFLSIGETTQADPCMAEHVAATMRTEVFGSDLEGNIGPSLDAKVAPSESRIFSMFEGQSTSSMILKSASSCCIPLISADQRLLGVLEFAFEFKILPVNQKLLECFASFITVSLEKAQYEELSKYGYLEMKMKKYMSKEERELYTVPEKLKLTEEEHANVFSESFDSPQWDGIGHFKVLFAIFDYFKIREEFKITNEKFFSFLLTISQTYKKVPYHNWRHAVDVSQFLTWELIIGKLENSFTRIELLALLVAAICHDANHDGFTNVFNVKAETPLGILYKNQSVMETHHCSVSIDVISKEQNNVFAVFNPDEFKQVWTMMIELILATDMAKHFKLVEDMNKILDEGTLNYEDPEHRLLVMKLLLKCADISNVSRPYVLADKWCDVLCEEFFRQGDLEKANGMEYTSPSNDREHLNKPKSQIGFYQFVCLPLYRTVHKAIPLLKRNTDQIESNLEVWKKEAAAKEEEEKSKC